MKINDFDLYLTNIIISYFTDRIAGLELSTSYCSRRAPCIVPQGSGLGPTVWNLLYSVVCHRVEEYSNKINNKCELISYADDLYLAFDADKHYLF